MVTYRSHVCISPFIPLCPTRGSSLHYLSAHPAITAPITTLISLGYAVKSALRKRSVRLMQTREAIGFFCPISDNSLLSLSLSPHYTGLHYCLLL